MRLFLIGFFACFISLYFSYAQSQYVVQNQYRFKHLTLDQGLTSNNIRSICQDSKGFIWIATRNGLNKFDGQKIVTYNYNLLDSSTISSPDLSCVFLDSKNNIWVSGIGGLDLYSADYNKFIRFKHPDISWPLGLIYAIVEDKDGKLWFGGASGLYAYDLNTHEIQHFSNEMDNEHGIPAEQIYKLLVDRNNNIWISILNKGLCTYYQANNSFKCFNYNSADPTTISADRIEYIYEDKNGVIWAGTLNDGLNRYVPENNSFIRSIPDADNIYSARVRSIFEDLNGNFFVGTRSGIYLRNNTTNEFVPYAYEGHNFSNLSQNSILCSFIDKTGILWIGTFSGGVNYTNLNRKEFIHYTAGKNDKHFLSGANIYAITEDSKGNIWVGGDNGLDYLDRTNHTFTYYKHDPSDPNSVAYNDIKHFEWDDNGSLWIATNRGGLVNYNVETGKFKSYRNDPDNPYSIAGDKIYSLMFDDDKNLWIILSPSSDFNFLYIDILPYGSDKFIHLKENSYLGLEKDKNSDMYIGGVEGFWIFSKSDSAFSFISNKKYIGNVFTIKKDSKNKLWIGSSRGLARYDKEDSSFVWYSENNGYPISDVFGILEDDAYNLWVSTNSGLVKISNIVKDTANIKFRVFDHDDGLQSKQFNYNAFHQFKSGEMAFGGINGFNIFYPEKIIENNVPPNVIITDLKIYNTSTPIGEEVGGRLVLTKSISVTDEIELGRKQNVFTLEFAALQIISPKKNTFRFKLEGVDKDWQYRKANNNFATYTNLSAGEYIFMVTAANNDGVWNEDVVQLKITIIPPIWETWWFRVFSILALISFISGVYLFRLRNVNQQNILLEETVKIRTYEISEKKEEILAQNEELEKHRNNLEALVKDRTLKLEVALSKAKESDELKSAFLANMSHEIRTPMNAITGFSSLLNEHGLSSEDRSEYIQIIQSNSNMLIKIIDEILDLSLIESNQLKLSNEPFELNLLFDHLFSYYYLSNDNSKREVRKKNALEDLNLKLNSDSTRINQIITNLMDNAFKFTQEGHIELGAHIDKEDLCIYVEDTGKGIPSKDLEQIFKQFTKVEEQDAEWTFGLGLGLAISKKIADALGAKITVQSTIGKGSTFVFSIPIGKIKTQTEVTVKSIKEPSPNNWKGKTILIAEDVEANFLFLEKALKKTQTNIIWVKNGEEALKEAFENTNIDLILMDIKMPKMNGYEVAKRIKEHNPDQIIVAQTAYARPEEKVKFQDENFDDYLSKPINLVNLLMILEQYL